MVPVEVYEVEMSEVSEGLPQSTEEALALSTARLSELSGKATPPGAAGGKEHPEAAQAAAEGSGTATPTAEPDQKPKADFSWVTDAELRSGLEATGSVKVADWLKGFQGKHTQVTQERARLADEVEALRHRAAAFDAIDSDPALSAAVAQAMATKKQKVEPDFDWANATSAQVTAEIRRQAQEIAKAEAKAALETQVLGPVQRQRAVVGKATAMFSDWKDRLSEAEYRDAWQHARTHYGDDAFSAENVETLFRPILTMKAAEKELAALKGAKAAQTTQALKATSPAGTSGVATAAPKPVERKPDGKKETARERTLSHLQERYGWTESDLEAAALAGA